MIKKGELKRIFLNFDADDTATLDMQEFMDMFIDNYIFDVYSSHDSNLLNKKRNNPTNIEKIHERNSLRSPTQLKKIMSITKRQRKEIEECLYRHFTNLYRTVTSSNELSLVDFVNLGLKKESVELFTEFMREIKLNPILDEMGCDFLPMSFDDMVEFLSYRSQRENIC